MTAPNAGTAEIRVVPDFTDFGAEVGAGIDAALQTAKSQVRNAFAALMRFALSKGVFDPLRKQLDAPIAKFGADLAQTFTNSMTRGLIDQMPGKLGKAFQSAVMSGLDETADSAGQRIATKLASVMGQTLGDRLGDVTAKAMVGLYKAFTGGVDRVKSAWNAAWKFLDEHGVIGAVKKAGTSVGNALMSAWQSAVERVGPILTRALSRIRETGSQLLPLGRQIGERVMSGLRTAWQQISPTLTRALEALKTAGSNLLPLGKQLGQRVLDGMKQAWEFLKPYAQQLVSGLSQAFSETTSAITTVGRKLGESVRSAIVNRLKPMVAEVGQTGEDTGRELIGRFGPAAQRAVVPTAENVGNSLMNALRQAFTRKPPADPDEMLFGGDPQGYQAGLGRLGQNIGRNFGLRTQQGMAQAQPQVAAQIQRTWHPGAIDSAIVAGTRAAGHFIASVSTFVYKLSSRLIRPAQRAAQALGEPFYNVIRGTTNIIGRLIGRVLPERFRDGAINSLSAFQRVLGPTAMTAIGVAAAGGLMYGIYKGTRKTTEIVAGIYTELSKGLLKAGEIGLKAGLAIVQGLGKGLAGVGKLVAGAVKTIGDGLAGAGRMAANAAGTAAAAVAGIGVAALKAGKDYNVLYQTAIISFRTILGTREAATQMMDDLAAFAKTSPFPRQAFIEGARTMLSFGYEAKNVIPTLDAIQNAAAATGRGAEDISEIVRIFSQVQSSGRLTGITLQQLGIRGINAAKMISEGMGESEAAIREGLRKGTIDGRQALEVLTKEMAKTYAGAAAGIKETWDGAVDRIKGATRDIGSTLMEPFISKEGGGMAIEWVNQIADLLRAVESQLEPIVAAFVDHMGPALGEITPLLEKATNAIKGLNTKELANNFATLGPIIGAAGSALAVFAGKNLFSGIPIIGDFVGKLNPLVIGLGALIAMSPDLQAGIMQVVSGPLSQMTGLFSKMAPLLDLLTTTLKDVLLSAVVAIMPVVNTLVSQLVKLAPIFVNMFQEVSAAFGPLATILGQTLARILEAWGPALGAVMNAIAALAGPLGNIVGVFARSFGGLLETLGPLFGQIAGSISGTMGTLLPAIQPVIGVLGRALSGLVTQMGPIIAEIIPIVGRVLAAVMPLFGRIITTLGRIFAQIMPVLMPVVEAVGGALVEGFKALAPVLDQLLPLLVQMAQNLFPALSAIIAAIAPVLPVVAKALGQLVTFLVSMVADVLSSPAFEAFGKFVGQLVTTLLPPLMEILLMLLEPFKLLLEPILELASALFPAIIAILEALMPILKIAAEFVAGVAVMFVDLARALVPLIVSLLPLLVAVLELALAVLEPFFPLINLVIQLLGPSLITQIVRVLAVFTSILSAVLVPLTRLLTAIITPIMRVIAAGAKLFSVFGPHGAMGIMGRALHEVLGVLSRFPQTMFRAMDPVVRFGRTVAKYIQIPISWLEKLWKWIVGGSPGLIPAFQLLGRVVSPIVRTIGRVIGTVFRAILTIVETVVKIISTVVLFYFNLYKTIILTALKVIRVVVRAAFNAIRRIISTVFENGIKPIFEAIGKTIRATGRVFRWLYDKAIRPVWRLIRVAFETGGDTIGRIFGGIDAGIGVIGRAMRWLRDRIRQVWDKISSVISTVWGKISSIFDKFRGAAELIRRAFASMRDKLRSIFNDVKDKIRTPVAWVVNNVINKIIGGINALITKIKIPPIPKIRGFHTGGKLPGYGGGDVMPIMAEPGETIVPKWGQRDPAFAAWAHSRGIPGYYAGGLVGANNGPNSPWAPDTRWSLPSWANPKDWGSGLVRGAKGIWRIGKDIVAEGGKMLRYAAGRAFEVLMKPLKGLLKPYAEDKTHVMREWLGKTGLEVINASIEYIKGKSESSPDLGEGAGELANKIVKIAEQQIGKPYKWNTRGPNTFDCSGLVQYAYKQAGAPDPGGWTGEQINKGKKVSSAIAADLVFYGRDSRGAPRHVALATGGQGVIHAPDVGQNVQRSTIRGAGYANDRRTIKRILEEVSARVLSAGGGAAAAQVWGLLRKYGLSAAQAAGVMGNMQHESGMMYNRVQGSGIITNPNPRSAGDGGYGLVQWTPGAKLANILAATGKKNNLENQVWVLMQQLAGRTAYPEGAAGAHLRRQRDPVSAARSFVEKYERPGKIAMAERIGYARGFYERFKARSFDQGGWLPPGISTVVNNTGQPEPILNRDQWDALAGSAFGVGDVDVVEVPVERGPLTVVGGSLEIGPDSSGALRAWIQDIVLDEADVGATFSRMGGGNW